MGGFFTRYFSARGEDVICSDVKPVRLRRVTVARSGVEAAKRADVVVVATPMRTTAKVSRTISRHMKAGSLLVDISSVKGDALPQLREIAERSGLKLLSIHPLFGPSLRRYKGMRIAVVEDEKSSSMTMAKRLFPGAKLFPMTADAHDALMAVMLSLTHLVSIAYAKAVADMMKPSSFIDIASPSSALQSALAQGVLSQGPSLCAGIQTANKHSALVVKGMAIELLRLNEMLQRGNEKAFAGEFRRLAKLFSADGSSMEKVYRAYDALAD